MEGALESYVRNQSYGEVIDGGTSNSDGVVREVELNVVVTEEGNTENQFVFVNFRYIDKPAG